MAAGRSFVMFGKQVRGKRAEIRIIKPHPLLTLIAFIDV
jgi:hypothetical protein